MITTMKKENKRLTIIIAGVFVLLSIPAIAMLIGTEVNWGPEDFAVMGILLLAVGLLAELILRIVKTGSKRMLFLALLAILFLLTWAELAVGIFGTPFAGN